MNKKFKQKKPPTLLCMDGLSNLGGFEQGGFRL